MDPPKHTVVVSIDEKSQIQALDRTQPGLPLKPGKCGTMTHDYKRNGTTTLFAALNILDGTVIGRCMRRHRHQEFIRFLNAVERAVPAGKVIHAIVDNYAAHKQPNVLKWLADHPRWTFHFTPTSASWLNAVEGFFSAITRRQIRRGAFHSVDDLQNAITRYINAHNSDCRPFTWTTSAKAIFEKLAQIRSGIATVHVAGWGTGPSNECRTPYTRVEPSRFPPRLGWPIARLPTTLTSAVLPAFNARSSAGRNSSGRSTYSP